MRNLFSVARIALIMSTLFLFSPREANPSPMDWIKSKLSSVTATKLSDTTISEGLKEVLSVGIEKAVTLLSQKDGYFKNEAAKILLPKNIQSIEPALRNLGFGPQIDELMLSMNRAAEKAAPRAAEIFASAITKVKFDDVKNILKGGDTGATDYLKKETYTKLLKAFQPAVSSAMKEYGVTDKYKSIVTRAKNLPLVKKIGSVDVSKYVSSEALDGLFKVLGEQETEIRTNAAARANDLLKKVFNKQQN